MKNKKAIEINYEDVEYKFYPKIGSHYRHYKGGLYEFIGVATHADTKEDMAIYKSVHRGTVYTRPLSSWSDEITIKGGNIFGGDKVVNRFTLLE